MEVCEYRGENYLLDIMTLRFAGQRIEDLADSELQACIVTLTQRVRQFRKKASARTMQVEATEK